MICRMLLLLALVSSSIFINPSFGHTRSEANMISVPSSYAGIPWKTQPFNQASAVKVTFAGLKTDPTFIVHLPDGNSFLLKSQYRLPNAELASNADAVRVVIQNFAQIITNDQAILLAYAEEHSSKSAALLIDETKLGKIGFSQHDPLRGIFQIPNTSKFDNVIPVNVSHVHFEIPENLLNEGFIPPGPIDVKATTITDRLSKILHFVLDSVVFSTLKAFNRNKANRHGIHRTWDEIGFQFGLKAEALGGLGKLNFSASGTLNFYIGFNKRTMRFVFRRGVRRDKLSDGVGASFSGKAEPKVYRIDSELAYSSDPRKGFASIKGETWYPPGAPFGSLSLDFGRGFQSDGIAVGPNLADIGGGFLMNTVTSFEEVQRVYSFGLPDIIDWLNSIAKQYEFNTVYAADNPLKFPTRSAHGGRCESLFRSTAEIGF